MLPTRVVVHTPPSPYPVVIGPGQIAQLAALAEAEGFPRRRVIVSSPTVWRAVGAEAARALPDAPVVLVPDGERAKHLGTVIRIVDALVKAEADRGTGLVAIGGGVVGDVAGFAAATFLRGIALAQVPTTLLAQVDSAIGGKVGVNRPQGKNLVGAFHQPRFVVVDPLALASLPRREFRAGLYEVVKYGMIASASLFARVSANVTPIFQRSPDALVPIIAESCAIKARIVAADERERGERRLLNFGHTVGHAIEAVTKYRRFRHGEAIAYGMLVAARVSVIRGALAPEQSVALGALLAQLGPLPPIGDLGVGEIMEAVRRDKKIVDGRLHFVVAREVGSAEVVSDLDSRDLEAALEEAGFRR